MERSRSREQKEQIEEISLSFNIDTDITPTELASLSKKLPDGAFVRSPHVGGQHGNQMAVLLPEFSGVEIHALDMNTLHRDRDFLPAYEVIPTGIGEPNDLDPLTTIDANDRYVANTTTNRPIKVGGKKFRSGASLSDVHIESMRQAAASPKRVQTLTEVYQDNDEIYQAVLNAIGEPRFASLIRRLVGPDGRYVELQEGQKTPTLQKYGFHRQNGLSNPNTGVVVPLEGLLVLDAMIRSHQTGREHIWHLAGQDMIKYIQSSSMQQRLNGLYFEAYGKLPKRIKKNTPPHVEMTIIPSGGLRFFGDKKSLPTLERTFDAYIEYQMAQRRLQAATKERNRQIGQAIRQLTTDQNGRIPNFATHKQQIDSTISRQAVDQSSRDVGSSRKLLADLVAAYPEPYLNADAQNCITQWHVISGKVKKLAFAPSYMDMSLGNLAKMQAELAQFYRGTTS
ncbi:MAG: hypothetical protein PVI21_03970 [Candidatus Woesebacteria bacterium]|jgi:hypothetical protein